MAQRKQVTWGELRVGIFVLAGILIVVVAIFYVTGSGFLVPKYRLVTYMPEVAGLVLGSPVTLDGVDAGNVDAIRLTQHAPGGNEDQKRSVEIVLRLDRSYQDYIRADSNASLFALGLVGNDRGVTIKRGYTGRVLQNGDELPGVEQKTMTDIVEHGADLMENLNALSMQVSSIANGVQQGRGTLGKLLVDESAYNHLNDTLGHVDQVTASIQAGQGTLGKLVASDELYGKVDSVAGRLDDVLAAVQDQKGSLGKLVYDPSIHDSAKEFLANSNGLLSDVRGGRGTLGKLATDDSLFAAWRQTGVNLSTVTAKLNTNESSAGKFLTDPQFYDNLTGLTGDLRLLVGDFRNNPKKFLRVKFSMF